LGVSVLFWGVLIHWSSAFPFFWDSILNAKIAHIFYTQTTFSLDLPKNRDQLPPTFSIYIAGVWELFGRHLTASHWAIFPFLVGISYHFLRLAKHLLQSQWVPIAMLLLLVEPTLLAQASMVAIDIPLVFCFLWSLSLIVREKRIGLYISLTALSLIYLRGTLAIPAIFLTDTGLYWLKYKRLPSLKWLAPYLFPLFFAGAYYVYHYQLKGYWVINPDSPWQASQQLLGIKGMARNIGIILWRCWDFGRVFLWIPVGIGILGLIFHKSLKGHAQSLIRWGSVVLPLPLFYSLLFIPYSNSIAHRYYLIFYLLFILFSLFCIQQFFQPRMQKMLVGIAILGLLTGSFWVYPDHIAKGWDATPAHWPYFSLREQMIAYIDTEGIPMQQIGSEFPNLASNDAMYLNGDTRSFSPKDFKQLPYILYSNIFNDFSDEELNLLHTQWKVKKHLHKGRVKLILYEKP